MSYSISSFTGLAISTTSSVKTTDASARGHRRDLHRRLRVLRPLKGVYRGRDEIDRVAGKIKATHPDFRYQPIVGPRNWAMVGGSNGYRAALVSASLAGT